VFAKEVAQHVGGAVSRLLLQLKLVPEKDSR